MFGSNVFSVCCNTEYWYSCKCTAKCGSWEIDFVCCAMELNVMCPSRMTASQTDFLSGDSASRAFGRWSQDATIVFSVDILLSTTQMQELCDMSYCKCEETTWRDFSWKRGRHHPRSPSWKKKIFRYLFLVRLGGGLYCYITRRLKFSLIQKNHLETPGEKENRRNVLLSDHQVVFRDGQWKEHDIPAHLYYILVVVME